MLEQHGYIGEPMHSPDEPYHYFKINASAVQAVRMMESNEKKKLEERDFVENVKVTIRRHPMLGRLCVVGIVLGTIVTVLNQFVSLIKSLGWIQ